MERWIKINSAIVEHWIFQDAEKLKWWIDLLFMAQWEDKKVLHDSHLFVLKRGQVIASGSFLAERWDVSRPTILKFLHQLEEDGMITRSVLYRQTPILTICNYDIYQSRDNNTLYTQKTKTFTGKSGCKLYTPKNTQNTDKQRVLGCKDKKQVDTIFDTQVDTIVDTIQEYNNNKKTISKEIAQKEGKASFSTSRESNELQEILEYFNEVMSNAVIPHPIKSINGQRRGYVLARIREHGKDDVLEVIQKASESDFLNGTNQRGWIADFNWLMKPNNFVKVLEGNYDNRTDITTINNNPITNNNNGNNYNGNQEERARLERQAEVERMVASLINADRQERNRQVPR